MSAFISRGDDFARQAQALRRKLTRPAATDLQIDFAGIKVSDLEPKKLPNLYHGAPLRIYGRYQGSGEAQVTVRGSINGIELRKTARLEFPKEDAANPEIDRMWAWRRIDGLLKEADRTGSRDAAISEVVRLGEGYSIVTEYTSFIVLENDAEYLRWKIARNNVLRTGRDRQSQEVVRAQLDNIRNKALASLGPQPESATQGKGRRRRVRGRRSRRSRPRAQARLPTTGGTVLISDTVQARWVPCSWRCSCGPGARVGSRPEARSTEWRQ